MLTSLEEIAGEILGGDDWRGSRDAIGASGGMHGVLSSRSVEAVAVFSALTAYTNRIQTSFP
jgi:hypothetical protein